MPSPDRSFITGRSLLILFRWAVFLLACAFLWKHLGDGKGSEAMVVLVDVFATPKSRWTLAVVFMLMLVNWSLESRKWRRLMAHVERIGVWRAFKATIAGTSVALITPNRTGEFLGRIVYLAPSNRLRGALATALGSMAQFVVTLVFGGLALIVMALSDLVPPWPTGWISVILVSLTALVATGALILYFNPVLIRQLILAVPLVARLGQAAGVLEQFRIRELLEVLLLSVARYIVFTVQFAILLVLFRSGIAWADALVGVAVVYLMSTMVPTVMLTEWGVRGSTALLVLGSLGGEDMVILLATTIVWVINLVLPALVGSLLLLLVRQDPDRP